MAQAKPPQPVKLIVGMLGKDPAVFDWAEEQMQNLWGIADVHSEIMPFTYTNYYQKQMGSSLLRKFVGFARLIDPGQLAAIKHQTNALETKLAEMPEAHQAMTAGVARPVNLDPGYVDLSKLVLASAKNYSHRIYIGNSMYAEVTLHYHKDAWQSWPYTYPDYAQGDYDNFLNQARQTLAEQLSSRKDDIRNAQKPHT